MIADELESGYTEGDIHFRDSLQFELKSEFFINSNAKTNVYKQEFFLFIPKSLNINPNTYTKKQFYLDQTNLIRYKTPRLTLTELVNETNKKSPLNRLKVFLKEHIEAPILDEIRLFGDIFRVALRDRVSSLIKRISYLIDEKQIHVFQEQINDLWNEVQLVKTHFNRLKTETSQQRPQLNIYFCYVDEFLSTLIEHDLTSLLFTIRKAHAPQTEKIDQLVCDYILQEQNYQKDHQLGYRFSSQDPYFNEFVLYRQGLLSKFMLKALFLNQNRFSTEEKHGHWIGAGAAGVAMFIYMVLFWQSLNFAINSLPFVLLVVAFYVLKDRIKEGIKNFYYSQIFRWFPDYTTEISSPRQYTIGHLFENFSFIESNQLPSGFMEIYNKSFNKESPELQQSETIIQYKREVFLHQHVSTESRRREITTIFRFNIHNFLLKADDALQFYLSLDSNSLEIKELMLPKIYYLNIIIRNTYLQNNERSVSEIKKFRVTVDKIGIKRVEQVS